VRTVPTSSDWSLNPPTSRYCNRVFDPSSPKTSSIFLTLLRIYLQPGAPPTAKSPTTSTFSLPLPATLLQPALQLISRHSRRLDASETLKLLPPLVQARDVKEFLVESLRVPIFDTRVIREIAKARRDDVATRLMILEERKVKVVDSRMCVFGSHLLSNSQIIFLLRSRGCFVDPFLSQDIA
jgi:Vam6/Vps39-like protein vacuolar protein sorting-associated protein 39